MCPTCQISLEPDAAFCGGCGRALRVRRATLVGSVFDRRYEIVEKLAVGGFGAIYRAVDLTSGKQIALKVLHASLASDRSLAARFRREVDILGRLCDPHTVTALGSGQAKDGTLYIALELLHGEGLDQRVHDDGPLAWRRALEIVREVCSSLAEAHALGVVHRDLKPANIFLARSFDDLSERVKVIDFGIAKQEDATGDNADLTRVGQAIGTLDYMAPEQLVGTSCDRRTDIYTLGVVAYEMLTGQRPFADASGPTSLITALLTRTPTAPSRLAEVVPEVDALVLRCLQRDPDDRYANVGEIVDAIDAIFARHPRLADLPVRRTATFEGCALGSDPAIALAFGAISDADLEITQVDIVVPLPLLAAFEATLPQPRVDDVLPRPPRMATGTSRTRRPSRAHVTTIAIAAAIALSGIVVGVVTAVI